jgi:HK97 family phage major capsid protein
VPPLYVPGVVQQNLAILGLSGYFQQQQTTSSSIRIAVEGTATSAATGVPEGGVKPESTLGLNEQELRLKKIATVLPISDEMLEDAQGVQAYVNGRLSEFVRIEEERQILRGSGGDQLTGIIGAAGVNITSAGTSNADRIFRAAAGVRGSAFVDPNLLVIHPTNWVTSRLAQDAAGQYYGGGPWGGQYGAGAAVPASSFSSSPYWNLSVWVTPTVGAGTALIGNSTESAALWRKGGVSVEASNSHSDYFVRNLNAIRAEERLALALYRPSAWVEVRGLT